VKDHLRTRRRSFSRQRHRAVEHRRSAPVVVELIATCRVCGCTDIEACIGGCYWVTDPKGEGDLCSACLPAVEDAA
jgi:hypothetical protein